MMVPYLIVPFPRYAVEVNLVGYSISMLTSPGHRREFDLVRISTATGYYCYQV